MAEETKIPLIKIPLLNEPLAIAFFPDELPEDHNDLIDVLRSELAPLKSWRTCAVEYLKRGSIASFDAILLHIVEALRDPELDKLYRSRPDYIEEITDIFIALAAKELMLYTHFKTKTTSNDLTTASSKKCFEYLKLADEKMRLNEYIFLAKGFFEVINNDLKRAEELFKQAYDRATKMTEKKKFTYGSLIGLGIVSYAQGKYSVAVDHFSRALLLQKDVHSSVKTALACCYYRNQQYDLAEQTLAKSFKKEAPSSHQLVLLGLFELQKAKKDRVNRSTFRQHAYEYLYLAHSIDETNAPALNLMANHHFYTWKKLDFASGMFLIGSDKIVIPAKDTQDILSLGNLLRLNINNKEISALIISVQERALIDPDSNQEVEVFEISISPSILTSDSLVYPFKFSTIDILNLKLVAEEANKALSHTAIPAVRAESFYILGKVADIQNNIPQAFEFYELSIKEVPDMILSAFGAARCYFLKEDYKNALTLFDNILSKAPDDKDTLAYVALLKGMVKGEMFPIDKLKEVAPGFRYEKELWMIQAELYHRKAADLKAARVCYTHLIDFLKSTGQTVPSTILNNISVLYSMMGLSKDALENSILAIQLFRKTEEEYRLSTQHPDQTIYEYQDLLQISDFENIFYSWSEVGNFQYDESSNTFTLLSTPETPLSSPSPSSTETILPQLDLLVAVGDEIQIQNILYKVDQILSPTTMICLPSLPIKFALPETCSISKKKYWYNVSDETLSFTFNLARLLEDDGNVFAAKILYLVLIKAHPSMADCYVRLGFISKELGKLDESKKWFDQAMVCKSDSTDIEVSLGYLYLTFAKSDEARKTFSHLYNKNKTDHQILLAMAKYNYDAYAVHRQDANLLRTSHKFFRPVLADQPRNVYAAHGLGIVAADSKDPQTAREIFEKVKSLHSQMTDEVDLNIANTYFSEDRYSDAERLYSTALKTYTLHNKASNILFAYLLEMISVSQLFCGRFEEAWKNFGRALRILPNKSACWMNFTKITETLVKVYMSKSLKSLEELEISERYLHSMRRMFYVFAKHDPLKITKNPVLPNDEYAKVDKAAKKLMDSLREMKKQQEVLEEQQRLEKSRTEELMMLRKREKEEEKKRKLEEEEIKKRDLEAKAMEMLAKLKEVAEQLNQKEVREKEKDSSGPSSSTGRRTGGKKRSKKNADEDESGEESDDQGLPDNFDDIPGLNDNEDSDGDSSVAMDEDSESGAKKNDQKSKKLKKPKKTREEKRKSKKRKLSKGSSRKLQKASAGSDDDDNDSIDMFSDEDEKESSSPVKKTLQKKTSANVDDDEDDIFGSDSPVRAPAATVDDIFQDSD